MRSICGEFPWKLNKFKKKKMEQQSELTPHSKHVFACKLLLSNAGNKNEYSRVVYEY
jgi:hypothetical protein